MTELLGEALRALGPAPTLRESELVVRALLDSKDSETLELLDDLDALVEAGKAAGAPQFAALDLVWGLASVRGQE